MTERRADVTRNTNETQIRVAINLDGTGLKQLTSGNWDDIEPAYLPDGDIVFCSTRSKRYVLCWLAPVATLHRCNPDGSNIRLLSSAAVTE